MFDDLRKSTTGVIDKAKLILNPNHVVATTNSNTVDDIETTTTTGNATQSSLSQQPDRLEELAEFCPQLTYQQRIIGFLVSFSMGCTFFFFF